MTDAGMTSPYRGLLPYTEADYPYFFGRDQEIATLTANLEVARFTLFYGPSGVGKTSLLRAGAVHQLRQRVQADLAGGGQPEIIPIYFNRWQQAPLLGLLQAVRAAVGMAVPPPAGSRPDADKATAATFPALLAAESARTGADLLIILDQFEEYFLYPDPAGPDNFADALVNAVNTPQLRANFVLSLREDGLARLDCFKGRIPFLLDNRLSVERLGRAAARQAIEQPLVQYQRDSGRHITIESGLVQRVVDQLCATRAGLARQGTGTAPGESDRIEAPYLQLVMTRLWAAEQEQGSRVLRAATLEALGDTTAIVATYLDNIMAQLSAAEQTLAAACFNRLVTPSGSKVALTRADIAGYSGAGAEAVEQLLRNLVNQRVLHVTPNPLGESHYEITHDVLGHAILQWQERYQLQAAQRAEEQRLREEAAQAAEQVRAAEKLAEERQRWNRTLSIALAVALLAIAVAAVFFFMAQRETQNARRAEDAAVSAKATAQAERAGAVNAEATAEARRSEAEQTARRAQAGQLAAASQSAVVDFPNDPSLALLLAIRAVEVTQGADHYITGYADYALRNAVAFAPPYRLTLPRYRHSGWVRSAAFSPDGKLIVTASYDQTARIWDAASGEQRHELAGYSGSGNAPALSLDGKTVVTAGVDEIIRIWDTATGEQLRELIGHSGGVTSLALSPNRQQVVSTSWNQIIRIWDAATGEQLRELKGHTGVVFSAAFSLDSRQIVTAGDNQIVRIWDAATGEQLRELIGHSGTVWSAAFSPDGKQVVTASVDQTAHIWDAASGAQLRELAGHSGPVYSAAFSPDGRQVVTAGEDRIARIWDAATGEQLREMRGHSAAVRSAAFSPDSAQIVTASDDQTARIWDAATGEQLRVLSGHSGYVYAAMFSPDGKTIVTASEDGTVRLWIADIDDLLAAAQRLVQRDPPLLTLEERLRYGLE
jgi:WD40 repeat protein